MDALILAGGKSRRMGGRHKGALPIGAETFTRRLINELKPCTEQIFLSYGAAVHLDFEDCRIVRDEYTDCGPMGGLHAGLKACESDLLLVAACDMPLLSRKLYDFLLADLGEYDAVVPVVDGQLQPLSAVYRKTLLPIFESCLQEKNYRLRSALEQAKVNYICADAFAKQLQNINTEEEYQSFLENL